MKEVLEAFANLVEGAGIPGAHRISISDLRDISVPETSCSAKHVESLLSLSRALTRSLVVITEQQSQKKAGIETEPESDPVLDEAILELVRTCALRSEAHMNRAVDELLRRKEMFSSVPAVTDEMLQTALDRELGNSPSTSSVIYVPKEPRLVGMPVPPADAFGEWDEYRDDMDPGYRVREVFERESDAASQSTWATQQVLHDGVILSSEPSPVARVCLDENDELCAAASVDFSQSISTPIFSELAISKPDSRSHTNSPVFGHREETTYKFDSHGDMVVVPRPTPAPCIDAKPISLQTLLLPVIYQSGRTGFEPSKEFDASNGTVVAGRYRVVGYLGSAAFSKAVRAVDLETQTEVCLKIIKNEKDFFDQSLDEIKILSLLSECGSDLDAKNILKIFNFFYVKEHLVIVTELLRDNLYEFSKVNRSYFTVGKLQRIAKQLLEALELIHAQGLIHCDLKPENILLKSFSRCQVKVIDLGSSCFGSDRLSSYIQSRSYRAPEVVLGCLPYTSSVDLWSLGCILAELWTGYVLFQNDSTQSLLARILGIIGPIPKHMLLAGQQTDQFFLPNGGDLFIELDQAPDDNRLLQVLVPKRTSLFQRMRIEDPEFLDFLASLLQIDPDLRPSAGQALRHPWLTSCVYPDGLN